MQRLDEVTELASHHALERHRFGRDDVHLEPARAERRRRLEADEAPADHDRALRLAVAAMIERLSASERR